MSNNTTVSVSQETFNLLYEHWSDSQKSIYSIKNECATNALYAFVTVFTQFVISQWIWSSKTKNSHRSPVYLVSSAVFILLWSMLMNYDYYKSTEHTQVPIGFQIAVPLLAFGGALLNLLFCWTWSRIFNQTGGKDTEGNGDAVSIDQGILSQSNHSHSTDEAEAAELGQISNIDSRLSRETKQNQKLHYINNIKIFLTCMVIILHMTCYDGHDFNIPKAASLFCTTLGTFLMNLFFFFSGYFSPRSLNKKGTYMFLFDKLKRLGIPLLIISYLLGPYCSDQFLGFLYGGRFHLPGLVSVNVAWFTQQLILFNVIFAFACGEGWAPRIKCPSLVSFCGISLLLGALAAVLSLFFDMGDYFFAVINFWTWYPSYIVFFFGGALAQANSWMDAIKDKSRVGIYGMAITYYAVAVVAFVCGNSIPPSLGVMLSCGIPVALGIPISLAVTVFFYDFVNREYAVTPFFTKAMYTAYLIQELFPNYAVTYCWLLIERAWGLECPDGEPFLAACEGGGRYFLGWIFRCVFALVLNWTLGYAIASIPGFSQVL